MKKMYLGGLLLLFLIASGVCIYFTHSTFGNLAIVSNCATGGQGGSSTFDIQSGGEVIMENTKINAQGGSGGDGGNCNIEIKDFRKINYKLTLFGSLSIISISLTVNLLVSLIKKKNKK